MVTTDRGLPQRPATSPNDNGGSCRTWTRWRVPSAAIIGVPTAPDTLRYDRDTPEFARVANLWWQHHELVALFRAVEPGMVGIMLTLLGAVALVPFPASLIGNASTDRLAVLTFVAAFTTLSLLFLLLALRSQRAGAFRDVVTVRDYYWMIGQWISGIVVLLVAALLAVWWPTVGLSILVLTIVLGPVAARRGAGPSRRLSGRFLPDE